MLGEVVDDGLHLLPSELARVAGGGGVGVAVDAAEVAGAGDVPDGDGFAGGGVAVRGLVAGAVAEVVSGLSGAGPEFGEIGHGVGRETVQE